VSVIHLNQIKNKITALFEGKIDLSDVNDADKTNSFLSRSLAAYAVHYLSQAEPDVSAKSVTDGYKDNGLDAIYYDAIERRLYLVQSKWFHSGTGEPENGDIKKFVSGISDLFNLDFDRFNDKVKSNRELIVKALNDPFTRYEAVIVYPSINKLSEPSQRDLDDLAKEMNEPTEMLTVTSFTQADLYRSLTAGISGEPINVEIHLKAWGRMEAPQAAIYGQVDGQQITGWWTNYGKRLFARNLRGVLGDNTDVNTEIRDTIEKSPELFWYFNNGITVVAKKVQKTAVGGGDTAYGVFHCEDISVVNGAQTVAAIGKYGESGKKNHEKITVQVRIISLQDSAHDFGEAVTKTNNRQNRIENRDFVALDPEQGRMRTELALDKIEYHVLREETASRTDTAFDLVESTTALACASGDVAIVVQLKREIGKLWEDIEKAPYKVLFNGSVSGLYLWRCVQVQRKIDQSLDALLKAMGVNSGREYGVAVHGNRLIASLVFAALKISDYKDPDKDLSSLLANDAISAATGHFCDLVRQIIAADYSNALIPTLFKNQTKCKDIVQKCNDETSTQGAIQSKLPSGGSGSDISTT
jgi:hypothetical protein